MNPRRSENRVPFLRPQLPPLHEVARYYDLAEQARYYSNGGPCERLLRGRLSDYLGGPPGAGGPHAIPVNNATSGIMIALRALTDLSGTSRRPLVVTPSYTFAATAGAIAVLGFRPLFVDVDPDGWQLDGDALARLLDERHSEIAAVLGTHTFGVPPAGGLEQRWADDCRRHSVPLVVDAAAAFGAQDADGVRTGTGDVPYVFSFHATKPFGIGEGGMISTRDAELARHCDAIRQFGFVGGSRVAELQGINAKMDELHAAVALTVLDNYAEILQARRGIAEYYRSHLEPAGFRFQVGAAGGTWQAGYVQVPDAATRDELLTAGAAEGVDVKAYYDRPLHLHPAFADAERYGDLPVTTQLAGGALALPMANDLSEGDRQRVVEFVLDVAGRPDREPEYISGA